MNTAADIIKTKDKAIITVDPDITVFSALQVMAEHRIGSVFVKEKGRIVGIYTERNLLKDMLKKGFDPKTALIRDFMTSPLITVTSDTTVLKLQDLILGRRIRHVLVENEKKETIGVVSAGDIMKAHLNDMSKTLESVSWDYYENWCFTKKK